MYLSPVGVVRKDKRNEKDKTGRGKRGAVERGLQEKRGSQPDLVARKANESLG